MSLKLNNLTKKFGRKVIFENFSYEFNDCGIYILRGKSGVGKTTLLRMISGLDKDFSGEILNGGIKNVSVCFQEYRLFPGLSALDNVVLGYGKNIDNENTEIAKKKLLLIGFSEDELSLLPSELSGGMKQRLSFLRAVLKPAPILILDEPTKELDPALREVMLRIIKEESERRLVIMVTHNTDDDSLLNAAIIDL